MASQSREKVSAPTAHARDAKVRIMRWARCLRRWVEKGWALIVPARVPSLARDLRDRSKRASCGGAQ